MKGKDNYHCDQCKQDFEKPKGSPVWVYINDQLQQKNLCDPCHDMLELSEWVKTLPSIEDYPPIEVKPEERIFPPQAE